jgi:hypothetical protein
MEPVVTVGLDELRGMLDQLTVISVQRRHPATIRALHTRLRAFLRASALDEARQALGMEAAHGGHPAAPRSRRVRRGREPRQACASADGLWLLTIAGALRTRSSFSRA